MFRERLYENVLDEVEDKLFDNLQRQICRHLTYDTWCNVVWGTNFDEVYERIGRPIELTSHETFKRN